MINRFKAKWGIDSTRRVVMILLAFSLAGGGMLYLKNPVFAGLGFTEQTRWWIKLPVALILYQVLLLGFGTLLGEFSFFWGKMRKLGRWLSRPFRRGTV